MSHPRLTAEAIAHRGEEIDARDLRVQLHTEENQGKCLIIAIATGAYEREREDLVATARLLARQAHAMTSGRRLGSEAAYALGGHLRGNVP